MRFYNQHHEYYYGVNLQASSMYLCIQDDTGTFRSLKILPPTCEAFPAAIHAYREVLAVAVDRMFSWCWSIQPVSACFEKISYRKVLIVCRLLLPHRYLPRQLWRALGWLYYI